MYGGSTIGSNMSSGGGGAITFAAILLAIFGNDVPKVPNNTGGDQIADSGPTNTGEISYQYSKRTILVIAIVRTIPGQIITVEIRQQNSCRAIRGIRKMLLIYRLIMKVPDKIMARRSQLISKLLMINSQRTTGLMLIGSKNIFLVRRRKSSFTIFMSIKTVGSYGFLEKAAKAKAFQPVNTLISRVNHG